MPRGGLFKGLLRGRAQGPPARADGGLDGPRSPAHLKGVRETCRNATGVHDKYHVIANRILAHWKHGVTKAGGTQTACSAP
jgi:hypothetical protein